MQKQCCYLTFLLFSLLLTACNNISNQTGVGNRIILWHSWSESDAAVLQTLIDNFTAVNENATVIVEHIPPDNLQLQFDADVSKMNTVQALRAEYKAQAGLGLGPNLLIGPSEWARELTDAGLIQDISGLAETQTSVYLPAAVDTLRYRPNGKTEPGLYGLPLSLNSTTFFYNKNMVNEPAETLDILLIHAEEGKKVALNINFDPAFWGIQAFGGRLFDQEGRVVLDQGGFANWLTWLKTAQNEANFIFDNDADFQHCT